MRAVELEMRRAGQMENCRGGTFRPRSDQIPLLGLGLQEGQKPNSYHVYGNTNDGTLSMIQFHLYQ